MLTIALVLAFAACTQRTTEDDKAAQLLEKIETLNREGAYAAALDSITSLRQQFPRAVNARRRALEIWQEASLKMTQDDIGRTDSALQAVIRQMEAETNIYKRNMLGVKRDSLQARYEGLIGTVRVIHKKMEENK
ncbi:MAG: hypothetical protein IKD78_13190 [Bacteroidales bacterium]|nr:hypothetical protein [Bacteroidales bacterium]